MTPEEQKALTDRITEGNRILEETKRWKNWLIELAAVTSVKLWRPTDRDLREVDLAPWGSPMKDQHQAAMLLELKVRAGAAIEALEAQYLAL